MAYLTGAGRRDHWLLGAGREGPLCYLLLSVSPGSNLGSRLSLRWDPGTQVRNYCDYNLMSEEAMKSPALLGAEGGVNNVLD